MSDEAARKRQSAPVRLTDLEGLNTAPLRLGKGPTLVAVGHEEPPEVVLKAVQEHQIQHFLQENNPTYESSIETAEIIVRDKTKFFEKPLVSILKPKQIDYCTEAEMTEFEYVFRKASEKSLVLEQLLGYLFSFSKRDTLNRDILLVADELFTNAIYNAPFVVNKELQRSGVPRGGDDDVSMGDGRTGRLFAGRDDQLLVLGCEDPYGTLNLKGLIDRILSCFEKGAGVVMNRSTKGGAGIGSYMIFHAANNFYALVENGQRTLICCGFVYSLPYSKRASLPKNLHLHGYNSDEE